MREHWKPVSQGYEASNLGRIRSVDRLDPLGRHRLGRLLDPSPGAGNYKRVHVGGKLRTVHSLVALAWLGDPPPGHKAVHIEGRDNSPANLKYVPKTRAVKRSDGKTYPSVAAAARDVGISPPGIRIVCQHKSKSAAGFGWQYI